MSEKQYRVYDWDDLITQDSESRETVVLPEGTYPFEVIKTEVSQYSGGKSIPPCPMVKAYLRIDGGDLGEGLCVENLYLYEKFEWKASNFLRAVGMKKHDEPIAWEKLRHCDGETGRCQVYVDEYEGNDGQKRKSNKIRRYYDKDDKPAKKTWSKGAF